MKQNVGTIDRIVRVVVAALIGVFYLLGVLSGPVAIALGILGVVFVATSAVGFCPLYAIAGLKTTKEA